MAEDDDAKPNGSPEPRDDFEPIMTKKEFESRVGFVRKEFKGKLNSALSDRDGAIAERDGAFAERDALKKELEAAKAASELEKARAQVAAEQGISDPTVLRGNSKEELEEHAKSLNAAFGTAPYVRSEGGTGKNTKQTTAQLFEAILESAL